MNAALQFTRDSDDTVMRELDLTVNGRARGTTSARPAGVNIPAHLARRDGARPARPALTLLAVQWQGSGCRFFHINVLLHQRLLFCRESLCRNDDRRQNNRFGSIRRGVVVASREDGGKRHR
ncbi:hypothetical protein RCH09_001589 [Actimicrobium sp. GrIS 1.19]|uniref:hypothetical protein n=1 Tax=Actimicrobium sp. GrIS 1.19 TaxID=3071708 RepID=UPI002E021E8A|nr:hypothetical protein [Actimicrobium sp. GrIS 1.19]